MATVGTWRHLKNTVTSCTVGSRLSSQGGPIPACRIELEMHTHNDNTSMAPIEQPLADGAAAAGRARPIGTLVRQFQPRSKLRDPSDSSRGWPGADRPIAIALARTEPDLQAAASLLRSRYASRGYVVSGLDARPASELTLIATESERPMGTLTVRLDGPAGLRADESYAEQLDAARSRGRRVCELGRFAVAREARSKPRAPSAVRGRLPDRARASGDHRRLHRSQPPTRRVLSEGVWLRDCSWGTDVPSRSRAVGAAVARARGIRGAGI